MYLGIMNLRPFTYKALLLIVQNSDNVRYLLTDFEKYVNKYTTG